MGKYNVDSVAFKEVNKRFVEAHEAKHPLVAVHRGSPGGSIIENSVNAIVAAEAEGADIVEIDVIRSADGEFYVFHNGYERLYFGLERDIRELSAAEIEDLQYQDFFRREAGYCGVEKLSEVLKSCSDTLLNIDRSWEYWDTLLNYLDCFECSERVLLKAPPEAKALELLNAHPVKYPFMPILKNWDELTFVCDYENINTMALELLAEHSDDCFAEHDAVNSLRDEGFLVLLNALNLPNRKNLYLGWDDEVSVLQRPQDGWGKLVSRGADIIQTDWPSLLNKYLES
ncbi:glycerophosphodiester phosphodiesterase family protein [Corynebacterium sp. MSK073]|jgi:hypothetical protein|uniref:glycerophosphodiester phosphodiesterase family protein n=1 Tax=Corynebacterium sp. MSK073 TaxID=3050198 RepID=UPI00254A0AB9|nr:glycerophosphodiester phosphodiesterase family protein [Corynebacterium sp. MSK073]MDK8814828.1 glycerophosphodiester phosphodiesterase family protein [Corynebacterium sp. MSK073]